MLSFDMLLVPFGINTTVTLLGLVLSASFFSATEMLCIAKLGQKLLKDTAV